MALGDGTNNPVLIGNNTDFRIFTGGTERILVENATGNIGIGNSLPGFRLDVAGNALNRGTTWASAGDQAFQYLGDGNHGIRAEFGTGVTLFTSGISDGVFLEQVSGNVGIGTASPTTRLQVAGDAYVNGNLGVGTTPGHPLHVAAAGAPIIDQQNAVFDSQTSAPLAQTFTAGLTGQMTGVAIRGTVISPASLEIQLFTGADPNAGTLLHSEVFSLSSPPGFQWYDFIFSTPVNITAGNQYHFKACLLSGSFNNQVATSGDPYPNGTYYYNFGFWNDFGGDEELAFRTYMASTGAEMVFTDNNELGVGVSTPTANLHVAGSVRFENIIGAPSALLQVDNTGVVSTTDPTDVGNWTRVGPDIHYSSGLVGIGIAAPNRALDILTNQTGNAFRMMNGGLPDAIPFGFQFGRAEAAHEAAEIRFTAMGVNDPNSFISFGTWNNASAMTLHGTGSMALGLNGTVPDARLHVRGGRIRVDDATNPVLELEHGNTGDLNFIFSDNNQHLNIRTDDAAQHVLLQTGSVSGNVGIGVVPTTNLDVIGNNSGEHGLSLRSGNGAGFNTSSQILFGFNGTTEYRHSIRTRHNAGAPADNAIDFYLWDHTVDAPGDIGTRHVMSLEAGFVGIGTTSPNSRLDVAGDIRINDNAIWLRGIGDFNHGLRHVNNFAGAFIDGPVLFGFSGGVLGTTEFGDRAVLRWTNTGRVGIGVDDPEFRLDVRGGAVSRTYAYGFLNLSTPTGTCGSCTGDFTASFENRVVAEEFNAISDARIKQVEQRIEPHDALNQLMQVQPTAYRYVDFVTRGPEVKYGVIAQEVEATLPNMVSQSKNWVPNIFQFGQIETLERKDGGQLVYLKLKMDSLNVDAEVGDTVQIVTALGKAQAVVHGVFEDGSISFTDWDGPPLQPDEERLFVFGKRVNDFRTVDYDQIFTLNVAATQAQQQLIEAQQREIEQLKQEKTSLERRLERIETYLEISSLPDLSDDAIDPTPSSDVPAEPSAHLLPSTD